jgi:L-gulonolactone oxidase
MRDLGGRPHWGKLHRRRAADLAPSYPQWDEFAAVRDRMDPDRRFANPELERVLGA